MSSPALGAELRGLADSSSPDVRMSALAGLAASGDDDARRRLAADVRIAAGSTDPAIRLRAAAALEVLDPDDRAAAAQLLQDEDVAVRSAALDSVQAGDLFAVTPTIAALGDARSAGAAAGAVGRLRDAVVPSLAKLLDRAGSPAPCSRSASCGRPPRGRRSATGSSSGTSGTAIASSDSSSWSASAPPSRSLTRSRWYSKASWKRMSATLSGSWQRWLRSTPRGTTSGRRISRSSARFATSLILSACA